MRILQLSLLFLGMISSNLALAEIKSAFLSAKHTQVLETLNRGDQLIIDYKLNAPPRRYPYYYEVHCTGSVNAGTMLVYSWKSVNYTVKLPVTLSNYPANNPTIDFQGQLKLTILPDIDSASVQCYLQEVVGDLK